MDGAGVTYWSIGGTRTSLIRVDSDTGTQRRSLAALWFFPEMQSVGEASVGNGCLIPVTNLCPVNHEKFFLAEISFSKSTQFKNKSP